MAGQSNKRAIRNLNREKFYAGVVEYPRAPVGTDVKNKNTGERFEPMTLALDTATGDLWYLADFSAGAADWRKLSDAEGSVTTLLDQVDAEVDPNTAGQIAIDGLTVANAANPSGIPLETVAGTNTLVAQIQVGAAVTGAPADKNDAGLSSYNNTQFAQDANGYVSLAGGTDLPGIQTITSDDPTIVGPDASGNVDLTGEAVANATNAKPVFVDAGTNALNVEVQVGAAVTGAPADKNDAGLVSADDTVFAIDANGYLTLATTGAATTITGDSGGALSPVANNWNILGGPGVTTSGSGATLTVNFAGSEIQTPGVRNLGIKLSAGTFSIVSADGTDLTTSNKGYVTLPTIATPGTLTTIEVTDNHQFVDDAGTSTIAGMLFGTTADVDWSSNMPFFIYCIMNDDDDEVAFGISRSPAMSTSYATANIGASGTIVTTNQNTLFLLDLKTGTTTPTIAEYDANPAILVGSFKMTKTSTTSNDWTVTTLDDDDGIGRFQWGTQWFMPAGVNGAESGTFFQSQAGTEPIFSDQQVTYWISENGVVHQRIELNNCTTPGTGGTNIQPTLIAPSVASDSGSDAYYAKHSIAASSVRAVYSCTNNGGAAFFTGFYPAGSSSLQTTAVIASTDEFSMKFDYKPFY